MIAIFLIQSCISHIKPKICPVSRVERRKGIVSKSEKNGWFQFLLVDKFIKIEQKIKLEIVKGNKPKIYLCNNINSMKGNHMQKDKTYPTENSFSSKFEDTIISCEPPSLAPHPLETPNPQHSHPSINQNSTQSVLFEHFLYPLLLQQFQKISEANKDNDKKPFLDPSLLYLLSSFSQYLPSSQQNNLKEGSLSLLNPQILQKISSLIGQNFEIPKSKEKMAGGKKKANKKKKDEQDRNFDFLFEEGESVGVKKLNSKAKIKRKKQRRADYEEKRGRKPLDNQMQFQLKEWILQQIKEKNYLTRKVIREKACILSKVSSFHASRGWLQKFFKRNLELYNQYKESRTSHFQKVLSEKEKEEQEHHQEEQIQQSSNREYVQFERKSSLSFNFDDVFYDSPDFLMGPLFS